MKKYKSFAITVRPRQGISEAVSKEVIKWLEKQDYYGYVFEGEGITRHMHAQVWMEKAVPKGVIQMAMVRIGERKLADWDEEQKSVMRRGIRIAYSDWLNDYCLENDEKIDPENKEVNEPLKTNEFYPTEEEQEALEKKVTACDQKYHDLNVMYTDWLEKNGKVNRLGLAAEFLSWAMFSEKCIKVIEDPKVRRWRAECLMKYNREHHCYTDCLSKEDCDTEEMIRSFENCEQ